MVQANNESLIIYGLEFMKIFPIYSLLSSKSLPPSLYAAAVLAGYNPLHALSVHQLQLPKMDALHVDWIRHFLHHPLHQFLPSHVREEQEQAEERYGKEWSVCKSRASC